MNDVFERLRDIPEPPLRTSAEVLATARRHTRRRTALRAATGTLCVLAAVTGASFIRPPAPAPDAAAPAPSASPSPTKAPAVPLSEQVDKHATTIARALITAVPTGYDAASVQLTGDVGAPAAYKVRISIGKGGYRAVTLVRVTAHKGSGVVAAVFGTDLPAPADGADLCAAHQDLGIEGATITGCQTMTVGGTAIRVVNGTDPGSGEVISATRYLDGGYVVVSASQGVRAYRLSTTGDTWTWEVAVNPRNEKALAEMPFTADRMAALATNPDLIP